MATQTLIQKENKEIAKQYKELLRISYQTLSDEDKRLIRQAFDVARRAILMCGRAGFALPSGKYGRWRDVVVDFRPDGVGFE